MPVDKNLFLHDLAVVAILKCEGSYLKEWLDYHLLAGVDHFYLYDNESPDNQRKVAAPYVNAGVVDYINAPGKVMQLVAYNDAVNRFKFRCRYMAIIDGDEFIFPKVHWGGACNIVEVVDEILSHAPNAAGLAINWQHFGSNGQDKADYSRGVLERFTRRAPIDFGDPKGAKVWYSGNTYVKTITDPRKITFINNPHYMNFLDGFYIVNENSAPPKINGHNCPVTADKIVINHYNCKSWEEYGVKIKRGDVAYVKANYTRESFDKLDRNEVFDDGILKYRAERAKNFKQPDFAHADERLFNALIKNLSPTLLPNTPPKFYAGKMETFLTCRAVAAYLQTKLTDATPAKFFEEAALKAMLRSIIGMSFADARLFLRELPELLSLTYPVVKDIRQAAMNIIPQMMNIFHMNLMWKDYTELDYLQRLLKTWH